MSKFLNKQEEPKEEVNLKPDVSDDNSQLCDKSALSELQSFYNTEQGWASRKRECIIYSNSVFKIVWDLVIMLVCVVITFITPYRLAFDMTDGITWILIYNFVDFCFLVDIIITFFTSVNNSDNNTEITDKRKIAIIYLKSWFVADILAIAPFDLFLNITNVN